MGKEEFLQSLRSALSGLPKEEVDDRIDFYEEVIRDRMEEGFSEEAAVTAVGAVNELASQIRAELVSKQEKPKKVSVSKILLLVGSPIWISLAAAVVSVVVSLYVAAWSLVISLWTIFVCELIGGFSGLVLSAINFFRGESALGLVFLAAGIVRLGLGIFLLKGSKEATKGMVLLTRIGISKIRKIFAKKEAQV